MTFTERINADIKTAMLAREKEKLQALRDIKAKLLLEATSGGDGEITDETAAKIVMKMHKQRVDTYNLYIEQGRQDLADDELFEASLTYFEESGFKIIKKTYDLHSENVADNIITEHEKMFSEQGIKIKALIAVKKGE